MHVYVITVHFYVSLVVFVFKMRVYDSLGCHWRTRMRTVTPTCPVMSLDMTAALPALREQWKPTVASGPALPDSAVRPLWPRTPPGRRAGGGRVSPCRCCASYDPREVRGPRFTAMWLLHYTTCSVLFLHDLSLRFLYSVTLLLFYFGLGPAQNFTWKFSFCSKPSPIPSHS